MKISLAKKRDATQIAKIHKQEINQGFLSTLGIISGSTNVKKFYKTFFKKYFIPSLIILLPKLFKLSTLKKIFETLKYPSKEKKQKLPEAELLTIAVLNEFHGKRIAVELFKKFIDEMKKRKIKKVKVVVGESLPRAIKFYEKVGFQFHSPISVHKNTPSRVYIYSIK